MTVMNRCLSLLLLAACAAAVHPVHAETPAASASGVVDLVLSADGRAHGWLLDSQGQAVEGAIVILRQGRSDVLKTMTDQTGQYELTGITSGTYQLQAGNQGRVIRVWDAATAPPAARPHLTLVCEASVIRGQSGYQAALYDDPGRLAGLGMVGIALGTITLIGFEATDNDDSAWPSSSSTMPPGAMPIPDVSP